MDSSKNYKTKKNSKWKKKDRKIVRNLNEVLINLKETIEKLTKNKTESKAIQKELILKIKNNKKPKKINKV